MAEGEGGQRVGGPQKKKEFNKMYEIDVVIWGKRDDEATEKRE